MKASAMPEGEELETFAASGATLAIHLSIRNLRHVTEKLSPFYGADCPVAVVYRASWPDEQIIRGTLADIGPKVKEAGITLQALVLVGEAFDPNICQPNELEAVASSHLYSETYTHLYRRAKGFESGRSAAADPQGVNGNA